MMRTVNVTESFATTPIGKATRHATCNDTTISVIFIDVEGPIFRSRTVAYVNTCKDTHEIVKCHPKGPIVGINVSNSRCNARILLPQVTLVRPMSFPFECSFFKKNVF